MNLALLTVALSTVVGWADITVAPNRGDRTHVAFQRSLTGLDRPSERTVETLKRYDVERVYRKNVDDALESLEGIARERLDAEVVYAIAELSWLEGRKQERWRRGASIDRYVDAVAYAYDFLFDRDLASGRNPSDPRFRLACEMYNDGLERLIRNAQSNGQIMPEGSIELKVRGRKQVLRIVLTNSPWRPESVDQVILASDYEVAGLNTRSYQYGLGVPLIGIHKPENPGKGAERFHPPEMAFPLTAFLVPNSRLREAGRKNDEPRDCVLQLVDPVTTRKVGVAPADLPVEADLTTPLAYMWSRTDLNRYRWSGLFRPGNEMGRANLMLLRPYEPGKIPVVMVHGLISSPLAWIPMINELLRDPVIQQRYQFLLYMYPTGVPVTIAGAGLRETLNTAREMYDPQGRDPAFDRMVLLGHSMGGLLSHEMAVDSGDKFWQLYSDRRFEDVRGEQDVLGELKSYLFFKPVPYVRRVVFLATPHRGSDMSRNVIGRVGSSLISEPDKISNLLSTLIRKNPDAFDRRQFRRMPTSIETLNTNSPMLTALLEMTPAPGVEFHSIIGSDRPGPRGSTTDGVVPYSSAFFEGAKSTVMVRSDHGVQRNPVAIQEVLRILHEHAGTNPITPSTPIDPPAHQLASPGILPATRR